MQQLTEEGLQPPSPGAAKVSKISAGLRSHGRRDRSTALETVLLEADLPRELKANKTRRALVSSSDLHAR
jgi:hypothetical protein